MWKLILSRFIWICAVAILSMLAKIWPAAKEIEQIVALAGVIIFLFGDFFWRFTNGWQKSDRLDEPDRQARPSRPKPPLGYQGPFWNKPSDAYLQAKARPYSVAQSGMVFLALLVPFAAMAYLLLH